MPAFTDANGKEWKVEIDAILLREVFESISVKNKKGETVQLNLAERDALELLSANVLAVPDVLWILCREQAAPDYVARNFGKALKGDGMAAGAEALRDAIVGFCPPEQRSLLKKAIQQQEKAREAGVRMIAEKVEGQEMLDAMTARVTRDVEELYQAELEILRTKSTSASS